MGVEVGYNVYLPPAYRNNKNRYPTIYFLHGASGTENSDAQGFSDLIHRAIQDKRIPPVIVVFPNGGMSGYILESCSDLKYETFFVTELVPRIDHEYRTITAREARAITGFSMGGGGALGMALKHPDLFSRVATWAAALKKSCPDEEPKYHSAPNDLFEQWVQNTLRQNRPVRILLIVGDQDPTSIWQQRFSERLTLLRLRHEFSLLPGVSHNLKSYYQQSGERMIKFLTEGLSETNGLR